MNRVQFGPHEVLIGLDWDLPSDNRGSEGSMIRSMLRSESHRGCRFGTVLRSTDGTGSSTVTVGFVPASEKTKPKIPSAAAMLALASQARRLSGPMDSGLSTTESSTWNWLVIEKLDDDHYWLVGIMQGAPLPTSDFVGSFDQVVESAFDFLRRGESDFIIHTRDDEVRSALAMHAESSTQQGFVELIGNTEGLRINEAIPKQIAGLRMSVLILAVVMLVGVVGTILFVHWRNVRLEEQARAHAAAEAAANAQKLEAEQRDYASKVQEAVKQALAKGKKDIDEALATPSPALIIQSWTNIVEKVDQDQSGWAITGVTCSAGLTPQCHVSLSRGEMGVNRLLLAIHPDAVIEGDKASFDLTAPRQINRSANWDHLDDARSLMVNLLSDLQLLRNGGLDYHQDTSKEIVQNVEMPKTTAASFRPGATDKVGPAPSVQMGVASGLLGIGGKDLWQLNGLGEFLDHDGISLKDISFQVSDSGVTDWKINANYYLRSKPQPVLPVIMNDGKPMALTLPKEFQEVRQAQGGLSASDGQATPLQSAPAASSTSATGPQGAALPPPPPPPPGDPEPGTTPQRF